MKVGDQVSINTNRQLWTIAESETHGVVTIYTLRSDIGELKMTERQLLANCAVIIPNG